MAARGASRAVVLCALVLLTAGLAGCLGDEPATPDEPAPAGAEGGGEPAEVDPGWPPLEEATIRPGVKMIDPGVPVAEVMMCTTNFLFSSPDNRTLYLGVASHCVEGAAIGDVRLVGPDGVPATIAYCSYGVLADAEGTCPAYDGEDAHNDLALLELPEEAREEVHPALLHWGGPTGIAGDLALGDPVKTYGNSGLRDGNASQAPDEADPREGVVQGQRNDGETTDVYLLPPSVPGDSGSPVLASDGEAIGVLRTLGVSNPATNGVTNLEPLLGLLHDETDLAVELKTWPTLADGLLDEEPASGLPQRP